jgi:hypothetical protein
MKKLFLACLCAFWAACESPDVVEPANPAPKDGALVSARLEAPGESLSVDEAIRLEAKAVFSGEIDSANLKVSWSISKDGEQVFSKANAQRILDWIPAEPGLYSAHAKVEYGEKTLEVYVLVIVTGGGGDAAQLDAIRTKAVGKWQGTVTTPWVPAYGIEMELREDGSYSAHRIPPVDSFAVPAMYYGVDEDSPLKTWSLDDVKSNGDASGWLQIFFEPTTTTDEIRHLRVGADGETLAFEMWHFGQYGPVKFALTRAP